MCRAGGPRCKGGGRQSKTTNGTVPAASTVTLAEDAPMAAGTPDRGKTTTPPVARSVGTPSREQADQLAAGLTRTHDGLGQPLDERGRRFFALRESGYKGPIDQDGYPDTTSESAEILRHMARDRGEHVDW